MSSTDVGKLIRLFMMDFRDYTGGTLQVEDQHSHQNLLESAMASEPSGHLDPTRAATHSHRMILGLDRGVWVAASLIFTWATMIHITVFHTPLHSLQAVALFWPMMQLHTGYVTRCRAFVPADSSNLLLC